MPGSRPGAGTERVVGYATIEHGFDLHYEQHYFGSPWRSDVPTVVLLHGNCESGRVWDNWVPLLSQHYRLICPDLPGFGLSRPYPADQQWSVKRLAADVNRLLGALDLRSVHVVGAKYGGSVAARLAIDFPTRVRTLSVVGSTLGNTGSKGLEVLPDSAETVRTQGITAWAAPSMRSRLGTEVSDDEIDWWINYYSLADEKACLSCIRELAVMDLADDLSRLTVPTLAVTTTGSGLVPPELLRSWAKPIPDVRVEILDSAAFHIAAALPQQCVALVAEHLARG